ncbi:uncharacterized protein K460DRAFT_95438 [Cucurbitaria berberidis CBS 394.84]|uniref:Uncharacterized protein n=1 Tax=Cucurbitaria berberidis CBS 394.84 TaxID=1168544 RepID=A0A9P4GFJ4_9PLEO|nr:uncharacterized protein K460DRAFT_95438 [Cucurbitaria berberidis CBS 394.84]KAF1844635.1 hypothetical protein K460DRAFT_95438 [Cucurbitaria berberidis CBS 394.84]
MSNISSSPEFANPNQPPDTAALTTTPTATSPASSRVFDTNSSPPDNKSARDLSLSLVPEVPPTTESTSSLWHDVQLPKMHIAKPGPKMRQNGSTNWPHGVLAGGIVIDILEHLSGTSRQRDWSIALWLQEHYIIPFGRVERLDGLIVGSMDDMDMIHLAHERYVELIGLRVTVQRLWVPGLEPTYIEPGSRGPVQVPALPTRFQQIVWRASDMYSRNGIQVPRKGQSAGEWTDELGWDRKIWMVPGAKEETNSLGKASSC